MKKLTLLLAFIVFSLSVKAQPPQKTQLTFDASVVYHPDNYFFGYVIEQGFSPRKTYDILPLFTSQFGIRDFIGRSGWFYEGNLIYNYTQLQAALSFPKQIDPYYGFVYETSSSGTPDIEIREHYHSLGLSAGAGYRWRNQKQNRSFALPIGIKSYNTLWRKSTSKTSEGKTSRKLYQDAKFEDWLYYGIYTKPSFEFSLSKKRSAWNFALFADASLIWNASSDLGPSLFLGGGLGVRYELH
ncbi:hypothetical protein [Owenweeksia hongkongensis]|uniref:hypothetical protein n=1 Tax=Owenweeksia hongkongensis TaxID=253245 RepID=UPI003A8D8EE6